MNYNELWHQLAPLYGDGEAKAIAQVVYEVRYGLTLSDIYLGKDTQLSADDQAELKEIAKRLADNEPVQYVLGVADFCGRQYHVEPGILIPRPETEHLCRLITEHVANGSPIRSTRSILDIGTGSGCIAITLALDIPNSHVTAWDISPIALRVAKGNAEQLGANVNVIENDMLQQTYQVAPQWDLIVSNPPYICDSEAEEMDANVLDYEPEIALFVPDDDPLQFYVPERLLELGFNVTAHDDQFGKTRFIQAVR